jgi:uncharacterized SAM-binding protein YcdF (DUF218 family)
VTPLTIAVVALVLGLLFGTIVVWGAPIFAIPIVVLVLAALGLGQMRRRARAARSMDRMREQAAAEKVEFSARDRETLARAPRLPRARDG